MGKPSTASQRKLETGRTAYSSVTASPTNSWVDVELNPALLLAGQE